MPILYSGDGQQGRRCSLSILCTTVLLSMKLLSWTISQSSLKKLYVPYHWYCMVLLYPISAVQSVQSIQEEIDCNMCMHTLYFWATSEEEWDGIRTRRTLQIQNEWVWVDRKRRKKKKERDDDRIESNLSNLPTFITECSHHTTHRNIYFVRRNCRRRRPITWMHACSRIIELYLNKISSRRGQFGARIRDVRDVRDCYDCPTKRNTADMFITKLLFSKIILKIVYVDVCCWC